ncbi:hypothetical protein [Clostridium perfringens]|jgi:hypothetical protein|uniref:hypothetical protein n=1 Tax=Clostridium perfringens TaxID=1502 RepID=UPI00205C6F22|nr:hypothetical protein [Clostridium perfringens]MDU1597678.1 hypothetical protein [Clostridium perfringens]MEA5268719.1 hypothetical protein [Clostridium perfringens]MEA5380358.1 hypothetical protein [Clostridium perfringens]DAL46490.1 MAG TPA_asm: hypothetical protein [Caudoviricetes sp.]
MSKFNEKTLERLVKWCDSQDTEFTRYSSEEKNGVVSVFRYDGHGFPYQVNSFFSNKEIENFLDESEKRQEELDGYHEEFLKELEEI